MTGRAARHNVTAPAHVGATEPSGGAQPRTQATQGTPLFVNFFSLSSWDLSRKRKETTFFLLRPLRSFVVTEPLDEHRVHGNGVRSQRDGGERGLKQVRCPSHLLSTVQCQREAALLQTSRSAPRHSHQQCKDSLSLASSQVYAWPCLQAPGACKSDRENCCESRRTQVTVRTQQQGQADALVVRVDGERPLIHLLDQCRSHLAVKGGCRPRVEAKPPIIP